jgi:hypothetical protein
MPRKRKIQWFARGGGIARCGPFKSQIEATNAMRLVKREATIHEVEQRCEFPDNVFVWPEEV